MNHRKAFVNLIVFVTQFTIGKVDFLYLVFQCYLLMHFSFLPVKSFIFNWCILFFNYFMSL